MDFKVVNPKELTAEELIDYLVRLAKACVFDKDPHSSTSMYFNDIKEEAITRIKKGVRSK